MMVTQIALLVTVVATAANVVLQLMTRRQYYTTIFDLRRRVEDLERQIARNRQGGAGQ